MFSQCEQLLVPNGLSEDEAIRLLEPIGFDDPRIAHRRLIEVCDSDEARNKLSECLPTLLLALADAATPDGSLINFERFVQSVPNRLELFLFLAENPRAVEILIRLFVGSQFLTEILLRNPTYLAELTRHKRLAEFKSREEFIQEARQRSNSSPVLAEKFDILRRYQRWELLRIGACDSFGLMDLKSTTIQLSLLTDSLVQLCLELIADDLGIDPQGFVVLGFGKLGGEELNYSSDIDLVFLSENNASRFWPLGQKLIKALMQSTAEGFLYRVDMRLRPWGSSGALVNTVESHIKYLRQHGRMWEKQALLKARPIAGDLSVGDLFLREAESLIYDNPPEAIRENVREMKGKIEDELHRQGRHWGEVKSGRGSIRDIEFTTQYLQLLHGHEVPAVRSFNTLDALVRLADFGFVQADEYRMLTSGYVFLRTVEHALQLMHHKQTHSLPIDRRELAYLARRLDYPNADEFLAHYERHRSSIRTIYDKYLGDLAVDPRSEPGETIDPIVEHLKRMEPSYAQTFTEEQIARHTRLLTKLGSDNVCEIDVQMDGDGQSVLTVVGYDATGDLSIICGLLFVYGFNIDRGEVFTDEHLAAHQFSLRGEYPGWHETARRFVDVFTIRAADQTIKPEVWTAYKQDLTDLLKQVYSGRRREAQGRLAKRVAAVLMEIDDKQNALYPITIEVDNEHSRNATVLHIRSDDTKGFLYELCNALAMSGIDISRVIISSQATVAYDTLYVTDEDGNKIFDDDRLKALRAAVVLIKHFTHLLPRSPNPESALLHFRDFLETLFERKNWVDELASLERTEVLSALARLLGVSDFLWEDFLRLQYENLFPVVRDIDSLHHRRTRSELVTDLDRDLDSVVTMDEKRDLLNAFKDREMFRIDMRHILGLIDEFGQFSLELTDVAEVIVASATRICQQQLELRYGTPRTADGGICPLAIVALGKCGGRELGFASDIELMFIYQDGGETDGNERIANSEFFQKLVEQFTHTIEARREGIFQIDLRLRPYGRAGSLAVSEEAFRTYFAPNGPAWPYERQALVKLRPIAGDLKFGDRIASLRDRLIYSGDGFDVAAMRGMRERQIRQLVSSGTINAKLSPGGLVDSEYLVQGLQINYGNRYPELRLTNTLEAMQRLHDVGVLSEAEHKSLCEAYIFQRQLIDALRMVRGHAKDLTVPPQDTEEFEFLARRLGYTGHIDELVRDIENSSLAVQELASLLDNNSVK